VTGDLNVLGVIAADAVAIATVRAIKKARGLGGLPAYDDLQQRQRR